MSDDLDPNLCHLFDTARGATEPTSEDRKRIRAALAAKLASGVLLTSASANAAAAAGSATSATVLGKSLKLVLLTQIGPGIVAGSLLGSGASLLASAASDAVLQPTDTTVSSAQVPAESRASPVTMPTVTGVSSSSDPPRDSTAILRSRSSTRAVADAPVHTNRAPGSAESATAAFPEEKTQPETTELSDELAVVSRIHESWQRGDEAGVRRAVQAHETRFPRGTLAQEREAVKVMLACRGAEPARAIGLGSAFLSKYPGSTHAARVIAICGAKR